MATRFYLSRTAFSTVNPGTVFTWGSSVKSVLGMYTSATSPVDTQYLVNTYTGYGAGTVLFRQWVSPEMSSGIVFDTNTSYTVTIGASESSTAANAFMLFGVAIYSSDGTTQRAKFTALEKDGTEYALHSTDGSGNSILVGRQNVKSSASGISYTTVAGDRLVLEVGWDQDASGSYSIRKRTGYITDSDLVDGSSSSNRPWFETSNTITFGGGDPPPPATNEDYELTAYITGVLDEWV